MHLYFRLGSLLVAELYTALTGVAAPRSRRLLAIHARSPLRFTSNRVRSPLSLVLVGRLYVVVAQIPRNFLPKLRDVRGNNVIWIFLCGILCENVVFYFVTSKSVRSEWYCECDCGHRCRIPGGTPTQPLYPYSRQVDR